ncbi:MAG: hypothetical protein L0H36_00485 [bacterium]|nr:hypothetical protein [bacterium]MDN5835094.1 hypothetical protein [bacterium]
MSLEHPNDSERRESFQQPVRRYFKALDNLVENYYGLYDETQKIFQHELGLDYAQWMEHDGRAGYKLLHKLGLPTDGDYEHDSDNARCRAAQMTVSHLGSLIESRVRTFDESWQDYNDGEALVKDEGIDIRDLEVWYLNAAKGAMAIYEKYSDHSTDCVDPVTEDNSDGCSVADNCPVVSLYNQLTTRSVYDGDSQSFIESDAELGLVIYKQKMHTAHDIGLVSQAELDISQRWTK